MIWYLYCKPKIDRAIVVPVVAVAVVDVVVAVDPCHHRHRISSSDSHHLLPPSLASLAHPDDGDFHPQLLHADSPIRLPHPSNHQTHIPLVATLIYNITLLILPYVQMPMIRIVVWS